MRLLFIAWLAALTFARPDAEAEADPVAQPQPDAEADPQMMGMPGAYLNQNNQVNGGMPSMNQPGYMPAPGAYPDVNGNIVNSGLGPLGPSWSPGGQGGHSHGDSCGAVDQCCNMSNENCCLENRRRCYVVYKRRCPDTVVKSSCRRVTKRYYEPYTVRTCRIIQQSVQLTVPKMSCKPIYEPREIEYNVTTCTKYAVPVLNSTVVVNQYVNQTEVEKCIDTKKCKMGETTEPKTTYRPEKRCEKVPYQKYECRNVQIDSPPLVQTKVIYDTVSRPVCRKMPKTVCSPSGCGQQGCVNPTYPNVCSTTNIQTENICNTCQSPIPLGGQCTNNCVQVQTPQCGTGSCQTGPQMCCRTEYQEVCTPQIQKVPRTVQYSIPQPPRTKQECQTITDYRESCKMVNVPSTHDVTVKKCNLIPDQHCFKVPFFKVTDFEKTEEVKASGERCEFKTDTKIHKVSLMTGQECKEMPVTERKMVNKRVCDQGYQQKKYVEYPVEYCERGQTPQCVNEPQVVCQDTCSQSDQCNYCSQQFSTGTLSQCPTSTCPNFIAAPRSM